MEKKKLIYEVADSKVEYIYKHGYAPKGCNGPYKNCDSAMRNSAHWLMVYSYLWNDSKKDIYYELVKILAEYLLQSNNYGESGAAYCRYDRRFDKTNGLIGQAWIIEALVKAAVVLEDRKYFEKAKKLFLLQPFSERKGLWDVLDCDNSTSLDLVYNHQLWFAVSGNMISDYEYDEQIENMIRIFLNKSYEALFDVYDCGLIVHRVKYDLLPEEDENEKKLNRKRKIESFFENPFKVFVKKINQKIAKYPFNLNLEDGYHLFDLYGFALLQNNYSDEKIFSCAKFQAALAYVKKEENITKLMEPCGNHLFNKFAFSYNSPAYEYLFVCKTFGIYPSLDKELFEYHINNLYDKGKKSFSRNCNDPETLDARVYEMIRGIED